MILARKKFDGSFLGSCLNLLANRLLRRIENCECNYPSPYSCKSCLFDIKALKAAGYDVEQ